jgi:VWFA-related protein
MERTKMAAALMLCAATALSQQPALTLPTFSESVEVRVLNLDVDVTDSRGNPVADLKRQDFILKVGGKAVPIDYFARVDEGVIHAPDLSTAAPDQVLATYRKGEEAFVPRNFLIFIDLGYLPPGLRNRSLNALRDLVARLGPNDATRVVLFDRSARVLVDWTTSKEATMAALSQIEKQGVGMSRLQSQEQALALIDGTPRSRRSASSRLDIARQYAAQTGPEIESMIRAMKQELVTLTPLNGKRAFLFVSGGFEYQPGVVMAQYAAGSLPTLTNFNIRDIAAEMTGMIQRANADQVTFYAVDATGLTPEGTPASEGTTGVNRIGAENRPSLTFQARQDRQNGLQQMALETGGIALLNTNDFQKGLSRVYQDVSTYYTLGAPLSKLGITGYQTVKVEVSRPGLTVRARRGFEPLPEDQVVGNRALATMETDLTYGAIPARIQTAPPTPEKGGFLLPITVVLPASALTFVPQGDKVAARAEFYVGSVDDRGGRSDVSRQETTFEIPPDKATADTMLRFDVRLQTKKGNYRIVVNVRDAASGRMGTARANVRVE